MWTAIALAAGLTAAGVWLRSGRPSPSGPAEADALYASVDRLLGLRPVAVGRTSRRPAEAPEPRPVEALGLGPLDEVASVARAAVEVERLAAAGQGTSSLHPLGLLRASEGKLDEAILLLDGARLHDPGLAHVLADLAAVRLSRFGERGDPEDLFQALTAAERALDLDPGLPAALFNRALAVSRLHLVSEAKAAWAAYLAADASEPWAAVAEEELRRFDLPTLEERWQEARTRLLDRSRAPSGSEIRQAVAEFPHRSRMLVLEELLPSWATAWRAGKRNEAEAWLRLARAIGLALESETGDVHLAETTAATEAAVSGLDPGVSVRRAVAYQNFGQGLALYYTQRYQEAEGPLRRAQRLLESLEDPLWALPAFYLASGSQFADPVPSSRALHSLRARFPEDRYPHLSGLCDWVLGTLESTTGDSERALRFFRDAQSKLQRSAADFAEGPVHVLLADAHRLLGQNGAASREYLAGLAWASRAGDRHRYHMALYPLVEMLVESAEPVAALSLGEELVAVAQASEAPLMLAESFLQRGRVHLLLGRLPHAREAFLRAHGHAQHMAEGPLRERILATLSLAEAELLIGEDSRAAVARLDRTLETKLGSGYLYHLTRTLYLRGLAHADLGAVEVARRDLTAAIEEYERLRAASESESHRRSTFELAQDTFDTMIALEVDNGSDPRRSLALAERSKARQIADLLGSRQGLSSLDRGALLAAWNPAGLDGRVNAIPQGVVFVEYSVLPDRLLIWVATAEEVLLRVETVARDELERRVAMLRNALSRRSPEGEIQEASSVLFDLLIAPIARELATGVSLVVVPDRFLARVPFAALYDHQLRRYLVEDREVSLSPAIHLHPALLRRETGESAADSGQPPTVLAVGAPEIDQELFPELGALVSAEEEAFEVARLYPTGSKLLQGSNATAEAFVRESSWHGVIHFAGHARVGPRASEHASLMLSPSSTRSGELGAAEIAGLDLGRAQLVVLSACSGLDGDRGGRESVTGLAAAFFAAGVPVVVAGLWQAGDRESRELMVSLHRAVTGGSTPAAALRSAQLALLRGADPDLRSPSTWGAYAALGVGGGRPG